MDANGVLKAAYDPDTTSIRVVLVDGPAGDYDHRDQNGAWSDCFDPTTNSLKVVSI